MTDPHPHPSSFSQDSLIGHAHSVRLEELYAGDCRLMLVDGDHNDPRPAEFFDRCQGCLVIGD